MMQKRMRAIGRKHGGVWQLRAQNGRLRGDARDAARTRWHQNENSAPGARKSWRSGALSVAHGSRHVDFASTAEKCGRSQESRSAKCAICAGRSTMRDTRRSMRIPDRSGMSERISSGGSGARGGSPRESADCAARHHGGTGRGHAWSARSVNGGEMRRGGRSKGGSDQRNRGRCGCMCHARCQPTIRGGWTMHVLYSGEKSHRKRAHKSLAMSEGEWRKMLCETKKGGKTHE